MAQRHPDNAAYVSADGKVSFDRYGRKLDSIGNVVAGDRQRAGDAGATPYEQPKRESRATPAGENGLMARNVQLPQRFTAGPGAKMISTAPQRSGWDNSVLPGTDANGRPLRPGVLAPGGIDPKTGKPYPTARNGGVQATNAWRQPNRVYMPSISNGAPGGEVQQQAGNDPWRGIQEWGRGVQEWAGGIGDRLQQSVGPRQMQSYVAPEEEMPQQMRSYASTPYDDANAQAGRMQTRSYVPPPQSTPSLFPNPPRYDDYINVYMPQLWTNPGEEPQGSSFRIPNAYVPETYTRPNVSVYDPNQLSWGVP